MAKGKRSKGTSYTSKGERRNVRKDICKAMRREKSILQTALDKQEAQRKGKKVKQGGQHYERWVPWHVGVTEYRNKFIDAKSN